MCGRYFFATNIDISKYLKILNKKYDQLQLDLLTREEIAPGNVCLSIVLNDCSLMKWGYKFNNRTLINTRLESLENKHFYDEDFKNHKCVLMASGFYEWDEDKKRYFIKTNDDVIYLAGLYQETNDLANFSIITKPATSTSKIHERVPCVFDTKQARSYLKNELKIDDIYKLDPSFTIETNYENISLF